MHALGLIYFCNLCFCRHPTNPPTYIKAKGLRPHIYHLFECRHLLELKSKMLVQICWLLSLLFLATTTALVSTSSSHHSTSTTETAVVSISSTTHTTTPTRSTHHTSSSSTKSSPTSTPSTFSLVAAHTGQTALDGLLQDCPRPFANHHDRQRQSSSIRRQNLRWSRKFHSKCRRHASVQQRVRSAGCLRI